MDFTRINNLSKKLNLQRDCAFREKFYKWGNNTKKVTEIDKKFKKTEDLKRNCNTLYLSNKGQTTMHILLWNRANNQQFYFVT